MGRKAVEMVVFLSRRRNDIPDEEALFSAIVTGKLARPMTAVCAMANSPPWFSANFMSSLMTLPKTADVPAR